MIFSTNFKLLFRTRRSGCARKPDGTGIFKGTNQILVETDDDVLLDEAIKSVQLAGKTL
jgi:hypothetical protein